MPDSEETPLSAVSRKSCVTLEQEFVERTGRAGGKRRVRKVGAVTETWPIRHFRNNTTHGPHLVPELIVQTTESIWQSKRQRPQPDAPTIIHPLAQQVNSQLALMT